MSPPPNKALHWPLMDHYQSFLSRHKLAIGVGFFALTAIADIRMTLAGLEGNLAGC